MAKKAEKKKAVKKVEALRFGKTNLRIFLAGLFLIILGYILMAQPPSDGFLSLHLAPVILIVAYLVVIPVAIMIKERNSSQT